MIFADKLIQLRKKEGWSQEDLAEKLNVSRQSVSKWEGAASVPDLDKIMKLSEIFGVSTDYLLKDSMGEEIEYTDTYDEKATKKVSVEEANEYISLVNRLVPIRSLVFSSYVLSPLTLILLCILADTGFIGITEDQAAAIGISVLLLIVAFATCIIIITGRRLDAYEYLSQDDFILDYGVSGIVDEKLKKYENHYTYCVTGGVFLCICGVLPLIVTSCLECSENITALCMGILFLAVAVAVYLFTSAGSTRDAYLKLLQKEDYTPDKKENTRRNEPIQNIYWLVIVAGFLGYSFITNDWEHSWIVWPVAGILYGIIAAILNLTHPKN